MNCTAAVRRIILFAAQWWHLTTKRKKRALSTKDDLMGKGLQELDDFFFGPINNFFIFLQMDQ
jgi:hypothetical protein